MVGGGGNSAPLFYCGDELNFHNTVRYGDALEVLKTLPPGIIQCCITSPPYWGLRDYSVAGQFGLEATPDEYIARMVAVFREVRRMLRDDGTVWLNLGDSYASDAKGSGGPSAKQDSNAGSRYGMRHFEHGLKPKDLCMIPARVALALQADGWWLRSDIIWSKPNPMPESCTDRPTTAHEHMFLLSKRSRYFYDADAIREEHTTWKWENGQAINMGGGNQKPGHIKQHLQGDSPMTACGINPLGRNKRTVWEIPTAPYPGAHFATFPPALVEPCILSGTSPRACEICGAPWKRLTEKSRSFESGSGRSGRDPTGKNGPGLQGGGETRDIRRGPCLQVETTGWQPTCSCDNEGKGRCLVLDPFAGSGTTGEVALKHGRDYLLIELNRDYEKLIRGRLGLFYSA